MTSNADLARSLYLGWNERDFDRISEMMAPDGEVVVAGSGEVFTGPEGARRYSSAWAEAMPDGAITIENVAEAGDCVVVEFTGRGTHTGTLTTAMGDIPATGRSITMSLCDVIEFEDGLIKRQRTYFDSGSMMAQLGLGEPAAAIQEAPR